MEPEREVDYILADCFFAVGQAVGTLKALDYEALVWWRARYREAFLRALTESGTSWTDDRVRVMAVGRYLGTRAVHHAGERASIDVESARKASLEIERGCQMRRLEPAPPASA
jgi:hypothetical protein